jgi:hypothetical protein
MVYGRNEKITPLIRTSPRQKSDSGVCLSFTKMHRKTMNPESGMKRTSSFCTLRSSLCVLILALTFILPACQQPRPAPDAEARAIASGLVPPQANQAVQAMVVPPLGWKPEPLKSSARHNHQVWISPSGSTAYGVIYINLPFPVGSELTLWGFLQEMQRVEGQANLISKENDPHLQGLRFVAEGGLYTIRANLIVNGFNAWAVYAGTLKEKPINEQELTLARSAREQTTVGLP